MQDSYYSVDAETILVTWIIAFIPTFLVNKTPCIHNGNKDNILEFSDRENAIHSKLIHEDLPN